MTPKYGIKKQIFYRNAIKSYLALRYGKKELTMVSLGGAHCLENVESIENAFVSQNENNSLIIPECDNKSFETLKKSLKGRKKTLFTLEGLEVCQGFHRGASVTLVFGTLLRLLIHLKNSGTKIDILLADYYCTLNKDVQADLDILLDNKILNTKGSLFLTSCDPGRAATQPVCQNISTFRGAKSYRAGIKKFLKTKFLQAKIQVKTIDIFDYDNSDVQVKYTKMHVVNLQVK